MLALVAAVQALRLWDWRPGTPFELGGDALFVDVQIRNILEAGWYGENSSVGAPFGQNGNWFPYTDVLHLFILKAIGLFGGSPQTVGMVYFVAGFPLAALTMYWLVRRFGAARPGAVAVAVLFAVVPGHQLKYGHLFLASYWTVPFGVALVLWSAKGQPLWRRPPSSQWKERSVRVAMATNARTAGCVALVAFSDVYYTAFTLILLAVVVVMRVVTGTPWRKVAGAVATGALMTGLTVLTLVPALLRTRGDVLTGGSPTGRSFGESEIHAGKLMDLLLPWVDHRADPLRYLTSAYNAATTPTIEHPALGVVALAGLGWLLWVALGSLVSSRPRGTALTRILALLAITCLAFYTRGGLGSFVALFGTAQIRTWSRLFLFVALLGLFAVALALTGLGRRRGAVVARAVAAGLILVGVLDQTNPSASPDFAANRAQMRDVRAMTASMEAQLPDRCAVFQLPATPFPEVQPPGTMQHYEQFLPYLASRDLRWSFGAIRGTARADWQLALPLADPAALADALASAGFCSIEVDRHGYTGANDPTPALGTALGPPLAATSDGRRVAFGLAARRDALVAAQGDEAVHLRGEKVLHPVTVDVGGSETRVDTDGTHYQWVGPAAQLRVANMGTSAVRDLRIELTLAGAGASDRTVEVSTPGAAPQVFAVSQAAPQTVDLRVTAEPGVSVVTIVTSGSPVRVAGYDGPVASARISRVRATAPQGAAPIGVVQSLDPAPPYPGD